MRKFVAKPAKRLSLPEPARNNRNKMINNKKKVKTKMIKGTSERPRLAVFRSNRYIYAQLIDDQVGHSLASAFNRLVEAFSVGEKIGVIAKEKKITKAVFDRRKYKYHGRVKTLAEGAKKGGLKF